MSPGSRRVARIAVEGVDEPMVFVVHPIGDQYVSEEILTGGWEPLETRIALRFLRDGALFVDCGANIGWYSVVAAKAGAHVISIEPAPDNVDLLRTNVRLNNVGDRVEVFSGAVGDVDGSVHLKLSGDNLGDHRVATALEGRPSVAVKATTLDAVLNGRTPRVLKIDTQGSEVAILRGLGDAVSRMSGCLLLVEFWPHGLRSCGTTVEDLLDLFGGFTPRTHRCFSMFNGDDTISPTSIGALRDLAETPDFSPEGAGHLNVVLVPNACVDRLSDVIL